MSKDFFDGAGSEKRTLTSVAGSLKKPWKSSEAAERQEFFLPISGFVWFFPEEMKIINHISFQRLSKINQLGQSFYVYRGATHKRIEHVLGVVGVIDEMISAVNHNAHKGTLLKDNSYAPKLSDQECRFLRLGALLHDIGHIAAGHTIEDELELLGKHDGDHRITTIFDKTDWGGLVVASLRSVIDQEYKEYVPESLKDKILPSEIVRQLIRKPPKDKVKDDFEIDKKTLSMSPDIRYDVCRNMIGNTICADILDYIYRDWYHIGKSRTGEGRIYQYMELRRQKDGKKVNKFQNADKTSPNDRFVIALGEKSKIRIDGISAILALLEWRYELAEAVLFHRTKVAASAMLERALTSLWGKADESEILEKILTVSDDELLDIAAREIDENSESQDSVVSKQILNHLKARNIYACLLTFDSANASDEQLASLHGWFTADDGEKGKAAKNRRHLSECIERAFDIRPGSIVIYHVNVHAKIAEVVISIDDKIIQLDEYERTMDGGNKGLSGGHLSAQIRRFEKLCKTYLFIEKSERDKLQINGTLMSLENYVKNVVFASGNVESINQMVRMHASDLKAQHVSQKKNDIEFVDFQAQVAKNDAEIADRVLLLNGANCLSNYFKKH